MEVSDWLCDVAVVELVVEFRAAAELDPLLDDVDVCVLDDVPEPTVALWLVCDTVDASATEPAGVALVRPGVERLLKARELMTASPAKPPVAVTLRARERRR